MSQAPTQAAVSPMAAATPGFHRHDGRITALVIFIALLVALVIGSIVGTVLQQDFALIDLVGILVTAGATPTW